MRKRSISQNPEGESDIEEATLRGSSKLQLEISQRETSWINTLTSHYFPSPDGTPSSQIHLEPRRQQSQLVTTTPSQGNKIGCRWVENRTTRGVYRSYLAQRNHHMILFIYIFSIHLYSFCIVERSFLLIILHINSVFPEWLSKGYISH